MMMEDRIGAFVAHGRIDMLLSDTGPLAGMTFAVKDFFDVAGLPTGAGSPDWLASHAVPQASASVVDRLLNAGARLVGKTSTDELAWSLNGENYHYGTPINPAAPKRIPGGSSSGSVVAVAGELVDFAVGSDTGGSVRLPASYCGVFGMRPTHARIPITGAVPLAPSYDTVGWFARSGDLLEQVGRVLIPEWREPATPPRFLIADDIFEAAGSAVKAALAGALESFGPAEHVVVADGGLTAWRDAFRIIQASEVWQAHSGWVAEAQPGFGPGIRERFADAARLDSATIAEALRVRQGIRERLDALLGKDGILLLPSAPGAAPLRGTPAQELEAFRAKALELLCGAGHAGLPQVSMPLGAIDGCPIGLSAMAPRGHDERLLQLVGTVTRLHG